MTMKKIIKRFWWIPVVAILAAAGFLVYENYQLQQRRSAFTNLQMVELSTGSISTTVDASGTVRASHKTVLSWELSGQVGEVLVQVGDTVEAGQLLASLDTTNLPDHVIQAKADLLSARQALEDLQSSSTGLATAQQAVTNAQENLTEAQQARAALDRARGDEDDLASAYATYELAQDRVERLQAYYQTLSNLPIDDTERVQTGIELSSTEKSRDKALTTLNWYKGQPTEEEIAAADVALALAQARYDDAVRDADRLKNGPSAEELAAAQGKIDAAQDTIDSLQITAPFAGTVTEVNTYAGETVGLGSQAFRIDDLSQIYIDLMVSEIKINQIQVGQQVEIVFDALPDKTYTGQVTEVGWIGSSEGNTVNFPITVEILDPDTHIKAGMTVSATILTLVLDHILLAPSNAIQTVNNRTSVFVRQAGQMTPVAVETGVVSGSMTQIVAGEVEEGDLIVANPAQLSSGFNSGPTFSLLRLLGGGMDPGGTGGRGPGGFREGGIPPGSGGNFVPGSGGGPPPGGVPGG